VVASRSKCWRRESDAHLSSHTSLSHTQKLTGLEMVTTVGGESSVACKRVCMVLRHRAATWMAIASQSFIVGAESLLLRLSVMLRFSVSRGGIRRTELALASFLPRCG
jgi:hypothetical protein